MQVITFHSYKGGAGRSSTALNTLPYLAKALKANKESPILVLDMDIDSAGMTYLLGLGTKFKEKDAQGNYIVYDIKSLLKGDCSNEWSTDRVSSPIEKNFLYQKFFPVGDRLGVGENEAVLFLGVNDGKKMGKNDMGGLEEERLNDLRRFCKNNKFSAIVIDSSTGDQQSASLSTELADVIVHCLRATRQFREGSFSYLDKRRKELSSKKIILLPTVVPNRDVTIKEIAQCETAIKDIATRIEGLGLVNIRTDFVLNKELFGINEVERFKWREGVINVIKAKESLKDDEKRAEARYETLANILTGSVNIIEKIGIDSIAKEAYYNGL